tara:strand:- start:38899 stop:39087 length:189 start_codon:yes stop_codon:yes gene_type:complete
MGEHQKTQLLFNFNKFGSVLIMGVDKETNKEVNTKVFGEGDNEDMILQFITDLENEDLDIFV